MLETAARRLASSPSCEIQRPGRPVARESVSAGSGFVPQAAWDARAVERYAAPRLRVQQPGGLQWASPFWQSIMAGWHRGSVLCDLC